MFSSILASDNPVLCFLAGWAPQWSNFLIPVVNVTFVSRPMFALAMDRMAPSIFAKVHPKWKSPYVGSIYWLAASIFVAMLCCFYKVVVPILLGIGWCYVFARMVQHIAEAELPFSKPHIWERGYRKVIFGIPLMAVTGVISTTLFLYVLTTSATAVGSGLLLAVIYFVGMLQFIYYAQKNMKQGIRVTEIYGELPPE
jgi:amino acid transporter